MNRWIAGTATASTVLLLSSALGTPAGSARPSVASRVAFGTIAVSDQSNAVLTFAPGSSGNVAPLTDITGAATGLSTPGGIGFDRRGNLYVANTNAPSITGYAPNATGNVAPIVTIAGSNTTLNQPIGLAVTPAGAIWVANDGGTDLLEFAAGAVGNVAPTRTIAGASTGLTRAIGLALTVDGKGVWVTDLGSSGTAAEREFSTHANGNVSPIATIAGGQAQLDGAYGVAVARDGSVVFSNLNTPSAVLRFGPHARGNHSPGSVITGSNTGLNQPTLLGLNPVGEIWVPNYAANSATRYPANAAGNHAPDHQLIGASTLINHPQAVAIYMQPPSAPRSLKKHVHHKKLTLRWHKPNSSGGGIEGYLVRHAKHKSGKYHVVKTTTKRSYRHHVKKGFYDVVAFNQAGNSHHSKRVHVT
jgi:sugar lactone lactonase YvrE